MSGELRDIARQLWEAETNRVPIPPLSTRMATFDDESAYTVQFLNAERRAKKERLVGYKVGLTSKEIQRKLHVFQPDFGHLFDSMSVDTEEGVALNTLIQPKIEGELAFVLGKDLKGPGLTIVDLTCAVDFVTPALEIVDSRIEKWQIRAEDTIADNGSSARYVLGGRKVKLGGLDLRHVGLSLRKRGEVWSTGAGAASLGNPINALVFLANELGRNGIGLKAGEVILSGALSEMLSIEVGDWFDCEVSGMGSVSVHFEAGEVAQ